MRFYSRSSFLPTAWTLFILIILPLAAQSQVTSTFSTNDEGWTFLNGASVNVVPSYSNSGGNPGGHISLTYSASISNTLQRWIAPSKFHGNQLRSLGQSLKFDLQQSVAGTNSISAGDVRITTSATGLTLVYSLPAKPAVAPAWTSYDLKLDETQGWRVSSTTGTLATRSQVIEVLTSLTGLEIRGTYVTNASYTSALDNVILEQLPISSGPVITSFSPTTAKPGATVTLTGTGFDADITDNMVFFGNNMIAGTISTASTTQLTVMVPPGTALGPIHILNKSSRQTGRSSKPFQPIFDDGGRIIRASLMPRVDIPLTSQIGNSVSGITAADMDGDGFTDLVVAQEMNKVTVHRHLGSTGAISAAMFAAPVDLAGAGNEGGLSTNDLDGDGKIDIIAAYSNGSLFSFHYFRNTSTPGSLSFEAGVRVPGRAYSGMLSAVMDVDGDGRPDLVGQHRNGSGTQDLWIAQNISTPGNIEFGFSTNYFGNSLDAGNGVAFGDLNNDLKPDLIVRYAFGGSIAIIENTSTPGNFSFGTPNPISLSSYGSIAIHDFNNDGKPDFAMKNGNTQDIIVRLNNHAAGSLTAADFATEFIFNNEQGFYGGLSLSDINGDGKPDFLITDASNLSIFENITQGNTFNSTSLIQGYLYEGVANSTYPTTPVSADLNHDSRPDIIVGINNSSSPLIGIYENVNEKAPRISLNTVSPLKGGIGSTVTITGNNFSATPSENRVRFGAVEATVLTATVNQLTVSVPAGASIGPVSVTRDRLTSFYHLPFVPTFSNGVSFDGTHFGTPVSFTLTAADYDVEVADLNRDGKPDVVAEGTGFDSYSFRNTHMTGAISVASLTPDDTTTSNAQNPRLRDIDDDGLVDMMTINGVYRNTSSAGDISFDLVVAAGSGGNHDFADFNQDGKTDFVLVNGSSASVFENRTTRGAFKTGLDFASFSAAFNLPKPGANGGAASADFDNDGLMDIASTNSLTDNVTIWKNNGSNRITVSQFTALPNITVGDNPSRIYSGDLDVDGRSDLFLYHSTSLFITILHNQSTPGNISFNRVDIPITGTVATTGTIGDIDGDGRPELLITQESSNRFSIFKNISVPGVITTASFQAPFHTIVTAPRGITTGDLNLDGKPEIVLTRTGQLLVYENLVPIVSITFTTQPQNATICENANTTFSVAATGDVNLTYQWQIDNGGFTDLTNTGVYSGVTTSTLNITGATTGLNNRVYRCLVKGNNSSNTASANATLSVNGLPVLTLPASSVCSDAPIGLTLSTSGPVTASTYSITSRSIATGLTASAGNLAVPSANVASNALGNDSYTNSSAGSLIVSYQVNGISSNGCVGLPSTINVTILPKPVMNAATAAVCSGENSGITLSTDAASVGAARYNFIAVSLPTGVTAETGNAVVSNGVNATALSNDSYRNNTNAPASVVYTVRPVSAAACVGNNQIVTLTINPLPSIRPGLDFETCSGGGIGLQLLTSTSSVSASSFTLNSVTMPTGLTPAATNKIPSPGLAANALASDSYINTTNGLLTVTYNVTPFSNAGCEGLPASVTVTINPTLCSNVPPQIDPASTQVKVQGLAEIDLLVLISDADNNLDPASLTIVTQPTSGAPATIINGRLQIDYANTTFSGKDQVVISACDITGACSTAIISIDVIGDIIVYNGVSPNGDQLNDIFTIEYIDFLDDTRTNKVSIYNRWGDLVWEGSNYDNERVFFAGISKNGHELPNGNYFFKIEFTGRAPVTGYLSLKK